MFLSFQQGCRVEGEGSLDPRFFKCHLFRLDVYHGGVKVQCLADADDVCCSRCVALEDRLCPGMRLYISTWLPCLILTKYLTGLKNNTPIPLQSATLYYLGKIY